MTTISYEIKRLDLKHSWNLSRGSWAYKVNIIVRLEKDGITGLGEAAPNSRYNETPDSTIAVIESAARKFSQENPARYYDFGRKIQVLTDGQTAAKAALDIALMDWNAKKLGVPLYRFFGLDARQTPETTFTIGIDSPEIMQQKVKEAADFPALKIKLGTENDEAIIAAIRAVTDKPLRVDANEGWKNRQEALEKIQWLATQNVEFVEQPMPAGQLDDMAWLKAQTPLSLIADESVKSAADIPKLAAGFHGINIKLMKAGGLQEALRMIWMAKTLGMKIMLGCMVETSIAISAAAAISPLADYAD